MDRVHASRGCYQKLDKILSFGGLLVLDDINELMRTKRIYATIPRMLADHTNTDQQSKACAASGADHV
jgi:hypothetical protein